MTQYVQQAQGSFPFLGILTLIFITLKLVGKIDWSWWWVLAPVWLPFAVIIVIALIMFLVALVISNS